MKRKKPTVADLMARIDALEAEVAALKAVAHPQHVMADPALTEAMKRIGELLNPPPMPPQVAPYIPAPDVERYGPYPRIWCNTAGHEGKVC